MSKGYKVKVKGSSHLYKLPLFCPHCRRPTGTIDDRWLRKLGVCSICVVNFVEERTKPAIDLAQYAPRGGDFEGMSREEIDQHFLNQQK
jgi:hypothetical protein